MVNLTDKKEVNDLNKQLEAQVSDFIKEMSSPFVNSLNDIEYACRLKSKIIALSRTLHEIDLADTDPIVCPKPTEEELKQFIGNILKNAQYDKARKGYTLYDYAIEYMKTGAIPEMPSNK